MIADTIRFLMSNFTLTFILIGLIVAAIVVMLKPKPLTRAVVVEELLAWQMLFTFGFANLYNFVMHVFFGEVAAQFIGWANSPFQAEVGFASLGFAALGFLGFRGSFDVRLAATVASAGFLWGDAAGHVLQMVEAHNYAPGNAGIIFYTDLLIPLIGAVLLWLQRDRGRPVPAAP